MAISDLTGTTWIINAMPAPFPTSEETTSKNYSLTFVSNQANYNGLSWYYSSPALLYDASTVWAQSTGWIASDYRTIEITGGTDATNAELVDWLITNAQEVSDAD